MARLPRKTGMKRCRNTDKFLRCVAAVAKRDAKAHRWKRGKRSRNFNPYAVCTASLCAKWSV